MLKSCVKRVQLKLLNCPTAVIGRVHQANTKSAKSLIFSFKKSGRNFHIFGIKHWQRVIKKKRLKILMK